MAVVSTMVMSRPLPSVTKWRYVIISGYFLYNLVQDPYSFQSFARLCNTIGTSVMTKVVVNFVCSV